MNLANTSIYLIHTKTNSQYNQVVGCLGDASEWRPM